MYVLELWNCAETGWVGLSGRGCASERGGRRSVFTTNKRTGFTNRVGGCQENCSASVLDHAVEEVPAGCEGPM